MAREGDIDQSVTPIPAGYTLLRRVPPGFAVPDGDGGLRPSSNAFDDAKGSPMSVYVEELLASRGRSWTDILVGHEGFYLVAFRVQQVLDLGFEVQFDPVVGSPIGFAHAQVIGKKTRANQRRLGEIAERRVWPSAP
jgi:hypothetical protein